MKIKKLALLLATFILLCNSTYAKQYKYETVQGDPLKTRIYTLDNGLKVFLTQYKDEPRIQTYIPVRVGSKNDPSETTGLAHYLEHMLFKGSSNFGTMDWAKEGPMIAKIDSLFEVYRVTKDSAKRVALYHQIDSISYEASKVAIPNEYDKLMQAIGATGTNAFTSEDNTCYQENIPSNQLENWAKIQSDRFKTLVLRLFHTELEAVYEEKNRSMTHDAFRMHETLYAALYPDNPYGTQTTIGTQEHLKNPSMKNIREFFARYYVANNMAITMSGDFEYDEAIAIIDKYFSTLSSGNPAKNPYKPETPVTKPVAKNITGLEADQLYMAFRIDKPANSKEADILTMLDLMLANEGGTGLIDANLNQKQKVYRAYSTPDILEDNMALLFVGMPKTGQTLEEVRDLLLEQVELLKQGKFDDWMINAAIANLRYRETKKLESNTSRAMSIAQAYMMNIPWEQECKSIDRYSKITKKDIVDFANKYFKNNYVIIYKRQGTPEDMAKMTKPQITPVHINRDIESKFLQDIKNTKVKEIQPVFVDFNKDMTKSKYKGAEVLYVQNKENKTFELTFLFPMGIINDLKLEMALNYLNYLGTSKYTAEQLKQEFYKLACSYNIYQSRDDESRIAISGLSENMEKALDLLEQLLNDAQPNEEVVKNLIDEELKSRADAKNQQRAILLLLIQYGVYGKDRANYLLSNKQVESITSQELMGIIKNLLSYEHKILYYGTEDTKSLASMLSKYHKINDNLKPVPAPKKFVMQETTKDRVLFVPFDASQASLYTYTRSIPYDSKLYPDVEIYNQYFGDGMNSIVFQEIREKRALAYSAYSYFTGGRKADGYYANYASIGTQNDKMVDAFDAFNDLFNNIPNSSVAFDLAKEGLIAKLETSRITKAGIYRYYLSQNKLGINYDNRKDLYNALPEYTMNSITAFNQKYIKNQPKTYLVVAREGETNFDALKKYGEIQKLTLEDIFGY